MDLPSRRQDHVYDDEGVGPTLGSGAFPPDSVKCILSTRILSSAHSVKWVSFCQVHSVNKNSANENSVNPVIGGKEWEPPQAVERFLPPAFPDFFSSSRCCPHFLPVSSSSPASSFRSSNSEKYNRHQTNTTDKQTNTTDKHKRNCSSSSSPGAPARFLLAPQYPQTTTFTFSLHCYRHNRHHYNQHNCCR